MSQPIVFIGLACIIAAIVGGGLDAFGIKVPPITSLPSKVLLAALGLVLVPLGLLAPWENTTAGLPLTHSTGPGSAGSTSTTGPEPAPCARTCYDFADDTTQGWNVRLEGGVRLGVRTQATDSPHVGSQSGSLAFDFHLGAQPTDKAQIEIDNVPLTKQLSTWVYVPRATPRTLELFGFVLEHNTGAEPGKPEWPFYKTRAVTLHAGGWTNATFAFGDFVGVNTNQTWSNPPLLLGFEIHSQEAGELDATVYFDHIAVD